MTKLTDMQTILLNTAVQREGASLLPTPEVLAGKEAEARKSIQQLIKRGLATETETQDAALTFREDGDLRFTAVITEAGKQAIGAIEPAADQQPLEPVRSLEPVGSSTKQAKVIELLQREEGASIAELQEATGWLPHTTRAALSGIRKRGMSLEKSKIDGITRYKAEVTR